MRELGIDIFSQRSMPIESAPHSRTPQLPEQSLPSEMNSTQSSATYLTKTLTSYILELGTSPSEGPMLTTRFALMVLITVPAWSAVIYSSLGPGDTYSNTGYTVYSGAAVAAEFVTSAGGALDSIRVPLTISSPTANLVISLRAPGADPNGSILESWVLSPAEVLPPVPPASGNILVLLSSLHPFLTSGSAYWLRAENSSPLPFQSYGWPQNVIGEGTAAVSLNQGLSWAPAGTNPAFEVNAATPAAIPEPASGVLLGLGLIALVVYAWGKQYGI